MPDHPIHEMIAAIEDSLRNGSFIKLSLGHYQGEETELKKIYLRKVLVKGQDKLSFTYRYKTRDTVKNYDYDAALHKLSAEIGTSFHSATLLTESYDLMLETFKDGTRRTRKTKPSESGAPALDHNRQKNRLIAAEGKGYLHDLKITDAAGNVFKNAQDKFRQINKYIEILDSLIKNIPASKIKRIADMGSGKGYLTFALYDYLTTIAGITAEVTGVEYRADMVELCNSIAKKSGFKGLSFVKGSIEDYDSTATDIMIALHACDTATDDAIYKGIAAGAELIVVAPCCHKQIRREIEANAASNDLDFLMKHGIFVERQAEMVTDALRSLMLEYSGYATKVFEFISDAHTPKNVLIVATKKNVTAAKQAEMLQKIKNAKAYFGITSHHLERLLKL